MSKKEKKKKLKSKQDEKISAQKAIELIYTKVQGNKFKYIIFLPILLVVCAGFYFIYSSNITNGYFGFPLDDPWIHLTFAKNLVEYGSFSYFKNEIVTSGSTSPLYTILVALFYFIVKNEFIISYIPGVLFGALLVYMIMKLSLLHFKNAWLLGIFTAMLIALQPKLNLINVSGMETSMFIFLLAVSLFAYQSKKIIPLGIFLGLTIWCRPDGIVLWIAIALDYLLQKKYYTNDKKGLSEVDFTLKEILTAFSIAGILVAGYLVFNYILSGSILPNTYRAKLEYYRNNDRANFLREDVLKYFMGSEFILVWIPFLFGVFAIIKSLLKKDRNTYLVYLLFIIGLIAVYYIKLPFAHRFGRYLMPVIPFYILIAVSGVKIIIDFIFNKISKSSNRLPNIIFILYVIAAFAMFINYNSKNLEEYNALCKYHNDRHVAAGKWLKQNTNESAIIATHDIGAIAFYGERKIIDMAGLVTPKLIDHLNDQLYSEYMNDYFIKNKVDYIITLRNWFEVVNDKPVFIPVDEFEFLEIFKYNPLRTHIQPKEVTQIHNVAIQMLQNGKTSTALSYLNQALNKDNRSSKTFFLLGAAYESLKDYSRAEAYLQKAIRIYPEYADALYWLAKTNFDMNKTEAANIFVNKCLASNPGYTPAIELKNRLAQLVTN